MIMNANPKRLVVVAVSALAALGGAAAYAQTTPDQATRIDPIQVQQNSVRVAYGDLNLDTTSGKDAMSARITRASHLVCQVNRQPLVQQMERLECVNEARRGAFDQLAANRSRTYAEAQGDRVLVFSLVQ
jgi:UrcA family protein